jgi:Big-like domain-containing protein
VANLVSNWKAANFKATTTTLSLGPPTTITHGGSMNVSIGVTATGATPNGDVSLIAQSQPSPSGQAGVDFFTLTSGAATGTTTLLPGGSYNVIAHYEGASASGNFFGGSDSTPVAVTVSPETSTTAITAFTINSTFSQYVYFNAGQNVPYGDLIYLHAAVAGASGNGIPTGTVSMSDNTVAIPGSPFTLSSDGSTSTPDGLVNLPAGSQSVTASYSGDSSFNSDNSSPFVFNITQAGTGLTVTPSSTSIAQGQSVTLTANFTTLGTASLPSFGNPPTGNVTFYSGTTSLGTGAITGTAGSGSFLTSSYTPATATASLTTTALPIGSDSITAVYNGDTNYSSSTSPAVVVNVSGPDFSLSAPQVTVTQGGTTTVTVTVTAIGNFTGVVGSFTCSSLPAEASCDNGNPTTVTGAGTTTITISTAGVGQARQNRQVRRAANETPRTGQRTGWMATAMFSLVGICVIGVPLRRRPRTTLVAMMILIMVLLPSCGGGGTPPPPPNPVPSISSLSPTQQAMGSQSQTLTINGTGFISSSAVTYNGTAHTATYVSGTQLTINLTASDMAATGSFPVVVTNPAPGGGSSSPSNFTVTTGTPVGTFPVTVTATSGTTQHSTTFNLVVQ